MKYTRFIISVLWIAIFLVACGGAKESTEINILCSVEEQWCEGMKAEFEAKFDIKVNSLRLPTGESLARLQVEKDDPQFDIWWGGPIDSYIVAKNDGLLHAYTSPNKASLLDQQKYKDPDDFWVGIYVGSLAFCTNKNWLAENPDIKAPTAWADLLNPEFQNQIMMAHPSTSGTGYTILSTILQMKGEEAGWNYLQQASDQISTFTRSGSAPINFVGEGEAGVCVAFSHDIIKRIENDDLPLVLTFPNDGTGYEIGGMAIVNGSKHLDAAKKWFDWALTAETQKLNPTYQAYQAPTIQGADPLYPELLEATLIDYDFTWAAEHKSEFVQTFIDNIATNDGLR